MIRTTAAQVARRNVENHMAMYAMRSDFADECEQLGDDGDAREYRARASDSLEAAAEALSIENHINGVSPE